MVDEVQAEAILWLKRVFIKGTGWPDESGLRKLPAHSRNHQPVTEWDGKGRNMMEGGGTFWDVMIRTYFSFLTRLVM